MTEPARAIVLRYGEIFLKGGNRGQFESRLHRNVQRALAPLPGARAERLHGRLLVHPGPHAPERALAALERVFGLVSLSPALLLPRGGTPSLAELCAAAVTLAREAAARRAPRTFKVETRRADKRFPLPSPEVSRQVGGAVLEATGLPVDVHAPDLVVGVEIGLQRSFVFADVLPGPGGLPVGSAGKVALLVSGGIDSPGAGWLMMKRGCALVGIYFHSFPYTGDKTREKVADLCRVLARWHGGPVPLRVVPFTDVQQALRHAGPAELAVVLYRRMMMRIASRIARREQARALATGESLGQVASQTLENLAAIEDAADLPVLRPLIAYDKVEAVALARRIGTYDLSILPYDDCCSLFVPPHPETRARIESCRAAEAKLDVDALADAAAEGTEAVECIAG